MEPQTEPVTEHKTCNRCGTPYDHTIDPDLRLFRPESRFRTGTGFCEACERQRVEELREQERQRQQAMRAAEFARRCPSRYAESDIDRLHREAGPNADKVLGWQYGPDGLLLAGLSGRCKTRLAWMLIRRLFVEEGRSFEWLQYHQMAGALQDASASLSWRSKIVRADVVLMDDLGKARFSDRFESELFGVIEERTAWCRPIICTTNDDPASLRARMSPDRGEPMVRRLVEYSEVVTFA